VSGADYEASTPYYRLIEVASGKAIEPPNLMTSTNYNIVCRYDEAAITACSSDDAAASSLFSSVISLPRKSSTVCETKAPSIHD
jgi:hypothetical protein